MSNATHAYIGVKPCGCKVAWVIDDPDYPKDTARTVAEFISDGLAMERLPIAASGIGLKKCRCPKPPADQSLHGWDAQPTAIRDEHGQLVDDPLREDV